MVVQTWLLFQSETNQGIVQALAGCTDPVESKIAAYEDLVENYPPKLNVALQSTSVTLGHDQN